MSLEWIFPRAVCYLSELLTICRRMHFESLQHDSDQAFWDIQLGFDGRFSSANQAGSQLPWTDLTSQPNCSNQPIGNYKIIDPLATGID